MPKRVNCPDCQSEISLEKAVVGEVVECKNCGAEMEIIQSEPLQVSLIEEEK